MGGSDYVEPSSARVRSIALVGRSGNGKSATGNSILGAKHFTSMSNSTSVTTTSELKTRVLQNGQTLNVIDTPGFFDTSAKSEFIAKEVAKCVHMAEGGLHAILVVFSMRNRFTDEEKSILQSLKTLFGECIYRYMIVVFTSGDELEHNEESLDEYLARGRSESLQELLDLCSNRKVVFDNRSRDEKKKSEQIEHLLTMVNMVMDLNGGRSFTDVVSGEETSEVTKENMKSRQEELIERLEKMLIEKFKNLEEKLEEETAARLEAERLGEETAKILRENLEKEKAAREKAEDDAKKAEEKAAQEKDVREKAEDGARKAEEKAAQEKAVREKAEDGARKAEERAAQEKAARDKAEDGARKAEENAEREKAAREKAEREKGGCSIL